MAPFRKEEELVKELSSSFAAVKTIKNMLIGDKNKKASFVKVGAVPKLLEVVQHCGEDPEPAVQALSALGSFAYGSEIGLRSLLESNALSVLSSQAVLGSKHPRVVEAACRALKQVYDTEGCPIYGPEALQALLRLLLLADASAQGADSDETERWTEAAELAAQVLAVTCSLPEHQETILTHTAGVGPILALLGRPRMRARQAGLDLLAALVQGNVRVAAVIVSDATGRGLPAILQLARSDDAATRLKAAHVITCLAEARPPAAPAAALTALDDAVRVAMWVLLRMAAEVPNGESPRILARLLASSEGLQSNACGNFTLARLIDVLRAGELKGPRQREGVVRAITSFCLTVEENRRLAADGKVIPVVAALLGDPTATLRAAACECLWALSRSFKALRGSFLETDVVKPLLAALEDAHDGVRTGASAALSNMVLEYTPLKEQVVREGGIRRFAALSRAGGPTRDVRINAMWAVENLVFMSKPMIREAVRKELPYATLRSYATEADPAVQEKAFGVLQNLLYGGAAEIQTTLEWSASDVPSLLQQRLASGAAAGAGAGPMTKAVTNALYAAVNVATGSDAHKDLVLSSGIAACLPAFLREGQPEEVQVAALWCLINLTWIETKSQAGQGLTLRLPAPDRLHATPSPALAHRLGELRKLGVEEAVRALTTFRTPLFVRERAQGVIDSFARISGGSSGASGSAAARGTGDGTGPAGGSGAAGPGDTAGAGDACAMT